MLFPPRPKPPADATTAPFVFDDCDHCAYAPADDGRSITADLTETRAGWSWGARWTWLRYDLNEPPEAEEESETGGPLRFREYALAECVAWMMRAVCSRCERTVLGREPGVNDHCNKCRGGT